MKPVVKKLLGGLIFGFVVIVLQHFAGESWGVVGRFNNSPIGRALTTIAISGLFIPAAKELLPYIQRGTFLARLLKVLEELARERRSLESAEHQQRFLRLYGNRQIDRSFIEEMKPEDAACFVLGLQFYYSKLKIAPDVGTSEFVLCAERAAQNETYRIILLELALGTTLIPEAVEASKFTRTLLAKHSGMLDVRLRSEDEDEKFFGRLSGASKERLTVFSTTSQISSASIGVLSQFSSRIERLDLYLVSPLVRTDEALGLLSEEYDVPACAIPQVQFLENRTFDIVRRVFRVLMAIEAALQLKQQTGIDVRLFVFRRRYPNLKVRLLKERNYMQVLPGSLRYANNLYRFGLEFTDKEVIERMDRAVQEMQSNQRLITQVLLDRVHVEKLKADALREVYWYVVGRGEDVGALESLIHQFGLVLKNPSTRQYVDSLLVLDRAAKAAVENHDFIAVPKEAPTPNMIHNSDSKMAVGSIVVKKYGGRSVKHLSVGVLFVADSRVLMIRKKQKPYEGKWSLIAGHVEEGETARQAIEREVLEELGVPLLEAEFLRRFPIVDGDICRHGADCHEWYVFVSSQVLRMESLKLSSDEISELEWMPFGNLASLDADGVFTFATRFLLKGLGLL
ncbi:NUDIX hydrolase [Pyxidicoccus xibeiensis]|uniref:NUDIX hydrolase n=1 Tax=Pyxidicoccus xibeiensis TaxID=2906759 RepID=UPI0020A6F062|nr:NUDIX hydrolase [Pyxidicoccus xibeiensis]MCP3139586.1 NUDIX hydrolase [Pyxidicoccus xibeiensis]